MKSVNTPKTTDVEEEKPKKVKIQMRPLIAKAKFIRCAWTGPVNVSGDRTPSGKGYRFMPGQTLPVEPLDYRYLLSLKRNPGPGCCGPGQERFYFEAGG